MRFFRRLGSALMLPVAVLPAAGILMGLGYWLDSFLSSSHGLLLSAFLIQAGSAIMDFLPLLFAVGIAYGLSKDQSGHAALAGLIAFLMIEQVMSEDVVSLVQKIPLDEVSIAFSSRNNAFIGIISAVIASSIYNFLDVFWPFYHHRIYDAKKMSLIVTAFVSIFFGVGFSYLWPIVYELLVRFAMRISYLGSLGAGLFGFFNRLLIPVGLHHALNSVFWFDTIGIDDIGKFWGQIEGGIPGVTGMYQAGFFPVMMFGLPGAALAIYRNAHDENKAVIGSLMVAASIASFLTGITEPLEFSFMFVAFELYLVHAFLTGLSLFIASYFSWTAGFTFSAGLIDLFLSSKMPMAHQSKMLLLMGLVYFMLYYGLFDLLIQRYDLATPGRSVFSSQEEGFCFVFSEDFDTFADRLIPILGGRENILHIDQCTTRLRVDVKNMQKVSMKELKQLPSAGVRQFGKHNIQIIIGPEVQFVVDAMRKRL